MSLPVPPSLAALAEGLATGGPLQPPPELHSDPEVLVLELRDYLFRGWIPVAHESELASPGDRVRCSIATREFLGVRQADGRLLAFRNRCLHAGYPIQEAGDPHSGALLVCKYHDWRYDLGGTLVGPDHVASAATPPCLPRYPVASRGGLVYLHPSTHEAGPAPLQPEVPAWVGGAGLPARRSFSVGVNWKQLAAWPQRLASLLAGAVPAPLQPCGRLAWFAADQQSAILLRLAPSDALATTVSVMHLSRGAPGKLAPLQQEAAAHDPDLFACEPPSLPGSPAHAFYAGYLAALQPQA